MLWHHFTFFFLVVISLLLDGNATKCEVCEGSQSWRLARGNVGCQIISNSDDEKLVEYFDMLLVCIANRHAVSILRLYNCSLCV